MSYDNTDQLGNDQINEPPKVNKLFYIVSIRKFTLLFFFTFGMYSFYWFYKNWANYKSKTNESIIPVGRAIFTIFYTHSLFRKVDEQIRKINQSFNWVPDSSASAFVVVFIIRHTLDRLSMKNIGSPYTDIAFLAILPIYYLTLLTPQKAINHACNDSNGKSNEKLTGVNYVWITLGIIIWLLLAVGIFMPAE